MRQQKNCMVCIYVMGFVFCVCLAMLREGEEEIYVYREVKFKWCYEGGGG